MARKSYNQVRDEVTQMFIKAIKEETPPWRQPWAPGGNMGMPRNFHSKRRYSGINPLLLIWTAMAEGYDSCNWGTFDSWKKYLGAQVRKGEKATHVIFFHFCERRDKSGAVETDDNGKPKTFPIMKQFPVFNADQVKAPDVEVLLDGRCEEGRWGSAVRNLLEPDNKGARTEVTTVAELQQLVDKFVPKKMVPEGEQTREQLAQLVHDGIEANLAKYRAIIVERNDDPDFEPAEELIVKSCANIKHGGSKAAYSPTNDSIKLPSKRSFDTMSNYYETAFHELVHWTKHKDRMNRDNGSYAFEELVAEIGACFLMMELGVPLAPQMTDHSKSYVKSWLQGMNASGDDGNGSKFIFDAATQAGKAVDYLLAFVGKENPEYEEEEAPKPKARKKRSTKPRSRKVA
jgi:antirestriction protein ArdC